MPVIIETRDKPRTSARDLPAPPPVNLSDFAHPREGAEGRKALIIWLLVPLILAVLTAALPGVRHIFGILLAWWAIAALVYLVLAPRFVRASMEKLGPEFKITSKTAPRIHTVLTRAPSLLSIKDVEGYMAPSAIPQAQIYQSPNLYVTSAGARDLLNAPEWDAAALRALIQLRQGHARRLAMFHLLTMTPRITRILAWPVVLYAYLLRMVWVDLADQTADRLTLLLIKNRNVLLGMMIKMHAATDPLMQDAKIMPREVDDYIAQAGNIGATGGEISTHFRLGNAISDNPYLGPRVDALMLWSNSAEYTAALEKLSSPRTQK